MSFWEFCPKNEQKFGSDFLLNIDMGEGTVAMNMCPHLPPNPEPQMCTAPGADTETPAHMQTGGSVPVTAPRVCSAADRVKWKTITGLPSLMYKTNDRERQQASGIMFVGRDSYIVL